MAGFPDIALHVVGDSEPRRCSPTHRECSRSLQPRQRRRPLFFSSRPVARSSETPPMNPETRASHRQPSQCLRRWPSRGPCCPPPANGVFQRSNQNLLRAPPPSVQQSALLDARRSDPRRHPPPFARVRPTGQDRHRVGRRRRSCREIQETSDPRCTGEGRSSTTYVGFAADGQLTASYPRSQSGAPDSRTCSLARLVPYVATEETLRCGPSRRGARWRIHGYSSRMSLIACSFSAESSPARSRRTFTALASAACTASMISPTLDWVT